MRYTTKATSKTPALVLFLLDISASMELPLGESTRISVAVDALMTVIEEMIRLSTGGSGKDIRPRYRVALIPYSEEVYPGFGGIQPIDAIASLFGKDNTLNVELQMRTNPAVAFAEALKLLKNEIPYIKDCPAPLVIHLTDAVYEKEKFSDPRNIAQDIMALKVDDGNALVENIYISEKFKPIQDMGSWKGVRPSTELPNDFARILRDMSSPFPETYRDIISEKNEIFLADDALMFIPGSTKELIRFGFQITKATS